MSALKRNNVIVRGKGSMPMMFAHGFGCDQNMWRFVAPAFEDSHQTILFDHVGMGCSDLSAYSREKYDTLEGYAEDIIEIARELRLKDGVFVGHSVSAMMGIMVAAKAPGLFKALVLVGQIMKDRMSNPVRASISVAPNSSASDCAFSDISLF